MYSLDYPYVHRLCQVDKTGYSNALWRKWNFGQPGYTMQNLRSIYKNCVYQIHQEDLGIMDGRI